MRLVLLGDGLCTSGVYKDSGCWALVFFHLKLKRIDYFRVAHKELHSASDSVLYWTDYRSGAAREWIAEEIITVFAWQRCIDSPQAFWLGFVLNHST